MDVPPLPPAYFPSHSYHWPALGHMLIPKPVPGKENELIVTGVSSESCGLGMGT